MGQRLDLHNLLLDIMGSPHVYFQPPASVLMQYPCIVYELNKMETKYADNVLYNNRRGYTITIIDKNPDSIYPELVGGLELASFDRHYVADGLHHFAYLVYY